MSNITRYHIVTFGCAQNVADSERIASYLSGQGMEKAKDISQADYIVINTCMVRQMAEDRVYGLVNNLKKFKVSRLSGIPQTAGQSSKFKVILTGCMVGMAVRDKTGKFLKILKKKMPQVDEFLPIEEIGFDHPPLRADKINAWVPVSNGCNNFCTFCVVPFTRGREISRPYEEIIEECRELASQGYKKITLLGMNVNSYGADLIVGPENIQVMRDIGKNYFNHGKCHPEPRLNRGEGSHRNLVSQRDSSSADWRAQNDKRIKGYKLFDGHIVSPVLVKHLGRLRIPTLFPYLLDDICKIEGIELVDFMSSNPWDFSDELIEVIARNPKITRKIHLPIQSGSNTVLRRMNRWYTTEQYLALIAKLKSQIPASPAGGSKVQISTDIIVGFCGETEEEFQETVDLCKKVGFYKAYIAMYSERPLTAASKAFKDDVPYKEKKRRWKTLEELINR